MVHHRRTKRQVNFVEPTDTKFRNDAQRTARPLLPSSPLGSVLGQLSDRINSLSSVPNLSGMLFSLVLLALLSLIYYHPHLLSFTGDGSKAECQQCQLSPPSANDSLTELTAWLRSHSTYVHKIAAHDFGHNHRGLIATAAINADEIVLAVPARLIIDSKRAKLNPYSKLLLNASSTSGINDQNHFALRLLVERQRSAKSPYYHYLNSLPASQHSMPAVQFYTNDSHSERVLELLQGSSLLSMIDVQRQSIISDYHSITAAIPSFADKFTFDQFLTARLTVQSRLFGYRRSGPAMESALVPLADLMNMDARAQPQLIWAFESKLRCFVLKSVATINKGDECLTSYGSKSNQLLMKLYGFSLERNDRMIFPLTLSLNDSDPLIDRKQSLFNSHGLSLPTSLTFELSGEFDYYRIRSMLGFARLIVADAHELSAIANNYHFTQTDSDSEGDRTFDFSSIDAVSISNEHRALLYIEHSLNQSLSLFGTTVEEDEAVLANTDNLPTFSTARFAVLVRRDEKLVLVKWRNITRSLLAVTQHPRLLATLNDTDAGTGNASDSDSDAVDEDESSVYHYLHRVLKPLSVNSYQERRELFQSMLSLTQRLSQSDAHADTEGGADGDTTPVSPDSGSDAEPSPVAVAERVAPLSVASAE